jgi:hypothetical protein
MHQYLRRTLAAAVFDESSICVVDYPLEAYNFPAIVSKCLGEPELTRVGVRSNLPLRTRETDQKTEWHRAFYETFPIWRATYEAFVRDFVANMFSVEFFYQAVPTFRVHLPGNLAVGEFHRDRDYGHPNREITFWVPLTRADGTNTIWVESGAGKGDYAPIAAAPGSVIAFDAGNLRHGNVPNATQETRISFDFRCLPERDCVETAQRSVNMGLRFVPGSYYALAAVPPRARCGDGLLNRA